MILTDDVIKNSTYFSNNHLCVAEASTNKKYLESFFYEPSDLYLRNQIQIKIKSVKIFDDKGNLFLEDTSLSKKSNT